LGCYNARHSGLYPLSFVEAQLNFTQKDSRDEKIEIIVS